MHAPDDNTVLLNLALRREGDALDALDSRRRWRLAALATWALIGAAALGWAWSWVIAP